MTVTLHFHGAAGTVTGSCYRIVHPKGQFLVDCGLFQGNKTVRALNQKPLPFDVGKIDFVLLTHAHIDHAGLLPKLYHHGYRGHSQTGVTNEVNDAGMNNPPERNQPALHSCVHS